MSELKHIGMPRRSGRYPWGSGENPYQSYGSFLGAIKKYSDEGMTDAQIAKKLGITTNELRQDRARANEERRRDLISSSVSMSKRGLSNVEIGKKLGVSEGSVRDYLKNAEKPTTNRISGVADQIEKRLQEVDHIDVSVGVERQLGIPRTRLLASIKELEARGYHLHKVQVQRLQDWKNWITVLVISKEKDYMKVLKDSKNIKTMESWTTDGGTDWEQLRPVNNVDSSRIQINYAEDGGKEKDGLIELRPGVEDLDLGTSKYAQVRIGVDGTHFLKGMAVISDDLPDGVDIRYNVTDKRGTPKEEVFKDQTGDVGYGEAFGSSIRYQRGALNVMSEEGDWSRWSKTLSSQFLSKQPIKLIQERLKSTQQSLQEQFDDITTLNNPAVKKHLLDGFIDDLGAKSRHLKVQGLPRTRSHVLIPYPDIKPNEVYAPGYDNGERVVLVRHPHGGSFEIPELIVNNSHSPARKQIGNALDAIGIHASVAEKMSGADFDGDTVLVIPNDRGSIKASRSLKGLRNFDPMSYQVDRPTMNPKSKDNQMGAVSNLITDMSLQNAPQSDIAAAVRHSMVVIDAVKHNLDYKRSESENRIPQLKKKYQTHINPVTGKKSTGASTIISTSKRIIKEQDPETGKWKSEYLVDMFDDARKLSSGTAAENVYADYINKNKALQNKAKKVYSNTPNIRKNKAAEKKYSKEVASLERKLNKALLNAPRERQAQIAALDYFYKEWDKETMDKDDVKKLKTRAVAKGRAEKGAKKEYVKIEDKEWEAIQAGAISNHKLTQILNNTDMDRVKELATPMDRPKITTAKMTRAKSMLNRGYTYAEVSEAVGVSATAIRKEMET